MRGGQIDAVAATRLANVFQTTHWSEIEAARGLLTDSAREALNHLCDAYWKPLYAHARIKGLNHHEASDVTQEVFQKLMRNEFLDKVRPERGRFRTYLLASLDYHIATRWARDHTQKRGSHAEHVELSAVPEQQSAIRSPDQEFDYQWMLAIISSVLNRLRAECEADARSGLYATLKNMLVHDADSDEARKAAATLGLSDEARRAALYRLRKRYRELFREEVGRTLANPFDVDHEIRHLLQSLR